MLVQFTVENFLSFKDKVTFSLVATNDASHASHLIPDTSNKDRKLLRAAAIYGANASGKSNLVQAISYARDIILEGASPNRPIVTMPFKLSPTIGQWSRFQFVFLHKGVQYTYGFKLSSSRIWEEFLYCNASGREARLFERITTETNDIEVSFGPTLAKGRKTFLNYKASDTRPNQLLLTSISLGNMNGKVPELVPVIEWFSQVLTIIGAESRYGSLEVRTHKTKSLKLFLARFLNAADTGICDVLTEERPLDWDRDLPDFPVEDRNEVMQLIEKAESEEESMSEIVVEIRSMIGRRFLIRKNDKGDLVLLKLLLRHQGEEGTTADFPIEDESDGTERMIHLAPMVFDMSEGRERVLIVDELDRRLHPHLSRMIINAALNCSGANQIVFTTHDTNLLDLELLRRDEIWFVQKDRSGSSNLYSLAEFKVRPDLQIEKGYLNGRFGAIPFIGDISALGWDYDLLPRSGELVHA